MDDMKLEQFAANMADLASYVNWQAGEKKMTINFLSDYFKYNSVDLKPVEY
jgi:hypothetical protein